MSNSNYNIIPLQGFPTARGETFDKFAIACWMATGFMLDNDSFYESVKWDGLKGQPWNYHPKETTLENITAEFAQLFEEIVKEQTEGKTALLALSGGLDSRTLAVALRRVGAKVHSYSYGFEDSFDETIYGKQIAQLAGWSFDDLKIERGYLWDKIETAIEINHGYSEFTHPRQLAIAEAMSKKGDVFLLGHWGDVLFDDMGIADDLDFEGQLKIVKKKILKKGGLELASDVWKSWNMDGEFEKLFDQRIRALLSAIPIENANARIRAFKSMYWATRWTSTNLSFFSHYAPIALPYYDDRMCKFICNIPEKFLAGRQIQIEYIRKYAPDMAKVSWQSKAPYHLFNHHKYLTSQHLPYRIAMKLKHLYQEKILGKPLVQRNWELQFLGEKNDSELRRWLFENPELNELIPSGIIENYYQRFVNGNKIHWSHSISMLLTLGVMLKKTKQI